MCPRLLPGLDCWVPSGKTRQSASSEPRNRTQPSAVRNGLDFIVLPLMSQEHRIPSPDDRSTNKGTGPGTPSRHLEAFNAARVRQGVWGPTQVNRNDMNTGST
jgi:hypothetical protein